MALTTLDPRTALILIDLQKGIVSRPVVHPATEVVARAAALAAAFRRHGLPVVLVHVTKLPPGRNEQAPRLEGMPSDWTELVPKLNRQESDHVITKQSPGAFAHTGLEDWLREMGVTQVVLGGIATSLGVESTARPAYDLGFNVTFATDAMTDLSAEAHENSLTRIFPRLGESGTVREIIDLLDRTRPAQS